MGQDFQELVRLVAEEVLRRLKAEAKQSYIQVLAKRDAALLEKLHLALGNEFCFIFLNEKFPDSKPVFYILPFISCHEMAELASGQATGSRQIEILQLLLSGCRVEVLEFEYKNYKETAAHSLYSLYEAYEKKLAGYGLIELKRKRTEKRFSDQMLVTEKDVLTAHVEGIEAMRIPAAAIITPLAIDRAAELDIKIFKQQ